MSYSKIKDKSYTGEPIASDSGELVIKDGKDLLVEGADYELIYPVNSADYTDIGTVNVTVAGKGRYVGSKTVSYKITGIPITKATINSELMKRNGFVYDGTSHVLADLSLTYKFNKTDATAAVLKGIDKSAYERLSSEDRRSYNYVYEYLNNINAGTATVVITGVNGFTGSVKKTFKIGKYTVKKTEPSLIKVSLADDSYEYIYPAVTPKPVVTYLGRILKEGKDYTLAYSNNNSWLLSSYHLVQLQKL